MSTPANLNQSLTKNPPRWSACAWPLWAIAVVWLSMVPAASAAQPSVVIERCSLFDPESGQMLPDQTIVIRGSQIVAVARYDKIGDLPADAT
ncbi:MAG: hypothetical protein JSS02_17580, partial [Planctomycetes bacterium]|nr:hypothetical protein [Planctomycetota bacterium]